MKTIITILKNFHENAFNHHTFTPALIRAVRGEKTSMMLPPIRHGYVVDTDTVIRHFIEKPDTWIRFNIFFKKIKIITK
jgi:hypothetical protein